MQWVWHIHCQTAAVVTFTLHNFDGCQRQTSSDARQVEEKSRQMTSVP